SGTRSHQPGPRCRRRRGDGAGSQEGGMGCLQCRRPECRLDRRHRQRVRRRGRARQGHRAGGRHKPWVTQVRPGFRKGRYRVRLFAPHRARGGPAADHGRRTLMNKTNWRQALVGVDTPLKDTIERMDASALQVALVSDKADKLIGVVTDGDIRRALLRGVTLESPTSAVMNPQPKTLRTGATREVILAFMRLHVVRQVPLLDEKGKIVELALLDDLVGARELP